MRIVPSFRLTGATAVMALCLSALPVFAAPPVDPTLTLFNGTSLLGWNARGAWTGANGILATNGNGDRHVVSAVPFGEFSLDFEYQQSNPMGAKLRIWTSHENGGGFTIDLDTSGAAHGVGSIASLSNSSIATVGAGWHRVQVEAQHGQMSVRIDGSPSGSASGLGSRAGYIAFQATGQGNLQLRNIKLTPLNVNSSFNGNDLNGWKSIARNPDSKGGVGHAMEKTFTFGMGGGSTKPHEAKWSVRNGMIHGESGPGGLENGNVSEDAVIQIVGAVKGNIKKDNFTALLLRNSPGQLSGGYAVGIGPYAGGIDNVAQHALGNSNNPVNETIVIGGRTIAIWVNGTLTTVHTDSRPESTDTAKGARTSAGAILLLLPNGGEQIDVQKLNVSTLSKASYGLPAKAPPPPVAAPQPVAQTTIAAPAPSAAETALLAQQQNAAKKDAADAQNKQRVASLMSQALSTSDPQQQMSSYGQVVQIDPSNAAAVQGFKEAQQKLQAQQEAQNKATTSAVTQQQNEQSREQQTAASLSQAQGAFLAGHLGDASSSLSVAERLAPGNPLVRDLRSRISAAQSLRSRLYFLGGGVGLLALAGGFAAWMRRRKTQRFPVLEITKGLDSGLTLPLTKDAVRVGAVQQDGGQKNDIVIRDVEHAVSRFHCEIVRRDGQLFVNDLNSSNGTRLDGRPLKPGHPEPLKKGSRILLANSVELRFGYDRNAKVAN